MYYSHVVQPIAFHAIQPATTLYISSNYICDPRWFIDSDVTHHIIIDPFNLAVKIEFIGNE